MLSPAERIDASSLPSPPGVVSDAAAGLIGKAQSPNTIRAYRAALSAFDATGFALDDAGCADAVAAIAERGGSVATARLLLAALRFRAKWMGAPRPDGPLARAALAGFVREHGDRGRGQARAFSADDFIAMRVAAAYARKTRGGVLETPEQCAERAAVDRALLGLLYHAALRRSEVAALLCADVQAGDDGLALVTVRRSKTNLDGVPDVRAVNAPYAADVLALTAGRGASEPLLGMSAMTVNRRFKALAKAAGFAGRGISSHAGRVTHASELTRRGADVVAIMRSGGWKRADQVAHYAAGAVAEQGAVAKYL